MTELSKWDNRFLDLAHMVGQWSKEPRSKVGAVIVRPNNTIASMGYNGFPRGVKDSANRLVDRELKNKMAMHAEQNAILFAREPLDGYIIYVTPLLPCTQCAGVIIQSGIKRVVALSVGIHNPEWAHLAVISAGMFNEAGVKYQFIESKS